MDEQLFSATDDGRGHFWLCTERGLFRTSYDMTAVQHFGPGEGIDAQHVYRVVMEGDSVLWACTSAGLMRCDTRLLDTPAPTAYGQPSMLLYAVSVDGHPLALGDESLLGSTGRLRLTWNLRSEELSLTPVLPDYANPIGRLYEYSLDGSTAWQLVDGGRPIVVSHLMPGRHDLCIRQAGMPHTERHFTLTVWPSALAWAELACLLVAIALLVWFRSYRRTTRTLLSEREEIEQALIESEQEQQSLIESHSPLTSEKSAKYQKIRLSDDECQQIERKMRRYLEQEHAYRNPDLKRTDIAEAIGVSGAKLSQVFSQHLGENYYDFVNRYRLSDFKKLIDAGEYHRYTVTALSEQCGFKRTSFFSTFRKVEGMTPMEYLKSRNITASL